MGCPHNHWNEECVWGGDQVKRRMDGLMEKWESAENKYPSKQRWGGSHGCSANDASLPFPPSLSFLPPGIGSHSLLSSCLSLTQPPFILTQWAPWCHYAATGKAARGIMHDVKPTNLQAGNVYSCKASLVLMDTLLHRLVDAPLSKVHTHSVLYLDSVLQGKY